MTKPESDEQPFAFSQRRESFTDAKRDELCSTLSVFVAAHPIGAARRARRARMVGVAGLSVFVLVGGGAAVASQVLGSKPVTNKDTARCYSKTTKDFSHDYSEMASPDNSNNGKIVAPVSACAAAWEVGAVQYPHPQQTPPPKTSYPVPHLVGCVLPNGTAAVFPGPDGTCQALGLATALTDRERP